VAGGGTGDVDGGASERNKKGRRKKEIGGTHKG
jgi:hypothetical protein